MKKILKKTLKYLLITLAVLLILLITLPYLFKNQIKAIVIKKIDAQVNAKVTFGDLSLSSLKHFPRFSVTLEDVCVTGVDEFAKDTLIAAKEIDVAFNLYKFIRGNHEIKGIHLDEPFVNAIILKNGKANYDIMKPDTSHVSADSSESSFELAIDKWSIKNGRIVYNDHLQKTYIEVGGLNHSGSGDFKQEISDLDLTTEVRDLTLRYNGVNYFRKKNFSADLQMEMNLKDKKFTFKDHNFQLGNFQFGFEGFFKLLDKGYETDIKFVVKETSFKNLLSLLPGIYKKDMEGIETAGEFKCDGFVKGIYDVQDNRVPNFHIDLQVDSAMFKYNHLPEALENINFEFVADNTDGNPEHSVYNLKQFHFEIDGQPTHGSMMIKGNKNMEITADVLSQADLAKIEHIYPIDGLSLKGQLRSEIKVSGIYNDSLQLLPAFKADVEIRQGALKYKALPKAVENINVHLKAHNTDGVAEHTIFDIPVFHLDIDKNPMHGNMSIKGLADMQIKADIQMMADLAHIEKIYPMDSLVLKGIVKAEVKLEGRYSDSLKLFPKADVLLTLENGLVKYKNLPVEMDSIQLNAEILNTDGNYTDTQIKLNHLAFRVDDEPFEMSGTISDLKNFNYSLKIDGLLDIAKITKLYPIANTSLNGTLDFDVMTKGSLTQIEAKNYAALKAKGTLEAKNVSYKTTDLAFPIHVDDALFTFNSHKIQLTRFKGEFGKSNITLTGDLYDYVPFLLRKDAPIKGDLTLHCDTMDLNEWFPSTSSTTGTVAATASTGTTTASQVIVIPSNLGFTFDSDIQMLKFGDLDIANLDGEIKIQNGVLTLSETGFNTLDSKITLSGDYTTVDPQHPSFDMDITVQKMDFNKAYKTFVDPKESCPAAGNFSTKYSLKGEVTPDFSPIYSTLIGSGKIVIDSVSVKGMKLMNHLKNVSKKDAFKDPVLSDVTITTEIKKGRLFIYPFTFQVSKFLTEVEGSQGIEDETIDYLIKLSVPPFSKLRIPMSIKGTADKPIIKMGKGFSEADFDQL